MDNYSLRDLCREHLGKAFRAETRYTEIEMIQLLDMHLRTQAGRIEKAKKIYREQQQKLDSMAQQEAWSLKAPNSVPPDLRAEYLRKLKAGELRPIDENGKVLVAKKKEGVQK